MSDGKPHPDASVPTINGPGYQYEQEWSVYQIGQAKVTSSRVAITVSIKSGTPSLHELPPHFLVWDWKTGVKYVVSGTEICWHEITTTFPRLQDIRRRSIHVQFVDEHRIFGVSHGLDPDSPQLVTLLDTSHPAGNPQELREIEFGLDNTEGPISLMEGTYAQGAKLGSSFRTNSSVSEVQRMTCRGITFDEGPSCPMKWHAPGVKSNDQIIGRSPPSLLTENARGPTSMGGDENSG